MNIMFSMSMIKPSWIKTPVARACLREDGIVCVEVDSGCKQTPQLARENLRVTSRLCGGVKRPVLVDLTYAMALDNETRIVYSGPDVVEYFSALALLTRMDPFNRLMANVYMNVVKLPIPTKVFSDNDRAIAWLHAYKSL